jgi:hypothetical protein
MSDPELLSINRPRCPKCGMRMVRTPVTVAAEGFEYRTFECLKCGHGETKKMPADPVMTQVADGWLKSELGQSLED